MESRATSERRDEAEMRAEMKAEKRREQSRRESGAEAAAKAEQNQAEFLAVNVIKHARSAQRISARGKRTQTKTASAGRRVIARVRNDETGALWLA